MKKTIKTEVYYNLNWTYGVPLSQIKKDIEELEKLGVTYIEIETYDNYGFASITITPFQEKEETDEEYKLRLEKEKEQKEYIKTRELEQLAVLSKKYNI